MLNASNYHLQASWLQLLELEARQLIAARARLTCRHESARSGHCVEFPGKSRHGISCQIQAHNFVGPCFPKK